MLWSSKWQSVCGESQRYWQKIAVKEARIAQYLLSNAVCDGFSKDWSIGNKGMELAVFSARIRGCN